MGGHITGVAIEQYPNHYDGAMPMCGVMGDNKLFDYFVENHFGAQALAGLDVPFPFPADYTAVTVPQIKMLFGSPFPGNGITPFPGSLTLLGQTCAGVVENLSGGDRPMFEPAFMFSGTGANFLFTQGVGSPARKPDQYRYRLPD